MDVAQVETRITSRTKAIMVVHIYGLPVEMNPLLALAHKHGLKVIEDAAEMHGQIYKGQPCGVRPLRKPRCAILVVVVADNRGVIAHGAHGIDRGNGPQ
jgi:hypothetical protein